MFFQILELFVDGINFHVADWVSESVVLQEVFDVALEMVSIPCKTDIVCGFYPLVLVERHDVSVCFLDIFQDKVHIFFVFLCHNICGEETHGLARGRNRHYTTFLNSHK